MNPQFPGLLIRRERLNRDWSQEGLCKGICAVSYLSKIEQGKAEPSAEVLELLFARLQIKWVDDAATLAQASPFIEGAYETTFALDDEDAVRLEAALDAQWETFANGPFMLDMHLLRGWHTHTPDAFAESCAPLMDLRQRTLLLLTRGRFDEALQINPLPVCYYAAGEAGYGRGDYVSAIEQLRHAYDLAARDGLVHIMLFASSAIGACYSNMGAFDHMMDHYRVTRRIAKAIGAAAELETLDYNTASTQLELGQIEPAYRYFSSLESPSLGALHKKAVCLEKMGLRAEALSVVDEVEAGRENQPDGAFWADCCALIRYRLLHPGYLKRAEYGDMLLTLFDAMRNDWPKGYAGFHLPWVIAWHKARRQYKQAFELIVDFPAYSYLLGD